MKEEMEAIIIYLLHKSFSAISITLGAYKKIDKSFLNFHLTKQLLTLSLIYKEKKKKTGNNLN